MEIGSQPGIGIKPLLSLKRHYRFSVLVWVLVILLGTPVAFIKGKSTYNAESVFMVAPRYMKNLESDAEVELQSNTQYREYVNHLSQSVRRFDVLEQALARLREKGIDPKPPALTDRRYIEMLQRLIYVIPMGSTYMVKVGYTGGKDEKLFLHELINAVMAVFLETSKSEQIYGSDQRLIVLKESAVQLRGEMAQMDIERVQLGEQLGLTTFTENINNPFDLALAEARKKVSDATADRVRADAALSAFRQYGEVPNDMGVSLLQMRKSDIGMAGLQTEITRRQEELTQRIAGLADKHPAKAPALAELQALSERMRQRETTFDSETQQNFLVRLSTTLQQKQQVETELKNDLQQMQSQASEFARLFLRAMYLTREIRERDSRLQKINDRLNYLETESSALGWVRLVSPALPADMPGGVGKTKLLLMVIVAAFGLALVTPIGIDILDRRIRSVAEAEKVMGIPAAGWQVLREDLPTGMYAEELTRRFAAALMRLKARHQRHVFAFSSASLGGGSTQTILDTAICLEKLGSRVLVVEANAFAPYPGFDALKPGLSDYLSEQAALEALPGELKVQGTVLQAVGVGGQPGMGLQRMDRLEQAIKQWSDQYDFVLVDLPPLLLSADAEMLIALIGQVFLVVEADAVVRGEMAWAKRLLQKIDPEAVGLFVNKISMHRGGGPIEDMVVATLTGSKLSQFRSLSAWQLQWAVWRTTWSMKRSMKRNTKRNQAKKSAK